MYAQKWPLFLLETREENPLFGVHTKNISQKIRQRQFCTNYRFSQRRSWLPILSCFRNELTFLSVRWRHLMVQKKWRKNHGFNANHAIVPPYAGVIDNSRIFRVYLKKGIFFSRFRQKMCPFLCMHEKNIINFKILFKLFKTVPKVSQSKLQNNFKSGGWVWIIDCFFLILLFKMAHSLCWIKLLHFFISCDAVRAIISFRKISRSLN